jgi:hypothetical protein
MKDNYRDNPLLKRVGVDIQYTEEQVQEYIKCAKDPIYFAKYIKIITLDEGLVPFKLYDFQEEMVKIFHENRFVITKCPRQVGKTTTTVAYLLWVSLFQDSQNIAILANRGQTARDILSKYQLAYENLPIWLQQGVITWNKSYVELENGSKITDSTAILFKIVAQKGMHKNRMMPLLFSMLIVEDIAAVAALTFFLARNWAFAAQEAS